VAAKQEKLVLPVEDLEFSTSEAILSRHAEPLKQPGNSDVLSEGGVQIRPSPSREFRQADNLIVFFRLYNAALSRDTGKTLVRVTLTVLKDGKTAMRPVDYQLIETVNETTPPLAFAKYIKLAGLAPGNYVALIQSRDMVQNKGLKQEVPFTVVP
jgi:hypothetical protein